MESLSDPMTRWKTGVMTVFRRFSKSASEMEREEDGEEEVGATDTGWEMEGEVEGEEDGETAETG